MKKLFNIAKHFWPFLASLGLVLTPFAANAESGNLNLSDPNAMVCEALGRIGIGCGISSVSYAPTSSSTTPLPSTTPTGNNNSELTAAIFNSGNSGNKSKRGAIVLVRVAGQSKIYELIGGKKHLIPTKDIFYDYGFRDELIQDITAEELNKYPRVKLIKVEGNKKKKYYLTEGQMVRIIPNKKIFDSYGNREEDVIVISKKEFNYYPSDQFVFLEKPLKHDIFQIVGGKKRYLTPLAVRRMKIKDTDVAPINETELTYYKTGSPIVF